MVKRKDTRMYLRYIYNYKDIHDKSLRSVTRGNNKEKVRTRLGCRSYHMRR